MSVLKSNYGPRPTNTLSRGSTASQPTFSKLLRKPLQAIQQLDTKTSTGDNVRCSTLEFDGDSFLSQAPPKKRRKTEPQLNPHNAPLVVDGSEDEDQLGTEDIVGLRHILQDNEDPTPLANPSQASLKPSQRSTFGGIELKEHRTIEKLMKSSLPNSRQRKNRERKRYRDKSGTPKSSLASSQSDLIEVVDRDNCHDPGIKTSYKGTANLQPPSRAQGTAKVVPGRSTEHRSPHFPHPSMLQSRNEEDSIIAAMDDSPAISTHLRHQYRDSNGKLCGQRTSASSDELTAADPNTRALSPVKTLRPQSPQISPRSDPTPKDIVEYRSNGGHSLESDIKPSTFINPGKTTARSSSRKVQDSAALEEPAPWSVLLRAYIFQGRACEGDGLGLVYKDSTISYDIHARGMNLAKQYPELRIRPAKLLKISFALDGTKMRFESSKMGTLDNVLDIELGSPKDVQMLNAVLQEKRPLVVKGFSRERMDSQWDHRLKEQQKPTTRSKAPITGLPEDVNLASRRLERADKKRAPDIQQQSISKRPRLIDTLTSAGQTGTNGKTYPDEISSRRDTLKSSNAARKSYSNASDEVSMQPLEAALTRSLRSRQGGEAMQQWPTDIISKILRESVPKYSKTHDMGRPWSKPLVYPREGKKRTTIEWGDLERLDEGEFLNDNIIAFYLRYLEMQAEQADPTIARKVYMFNTFFYERLTAADAGHKGFNYDAIRKWTRGVDIFTYDFVVVPVNESAHWYIAIICNLPSIRRRLGGFDNDSDAEVERGINDGTNDHAAVKHGVSLPSPQSRSGEDEHQGEVPLLPDALPSVKEQETAASFAEMSLDTKDGSLLQGLEPSSCDLQDPGPAADQEQLDDQLRQPVEENCGQDAPSAQELQQNGGIDEEVEQIEKASQSHIKPKKRKSLPSPRVFDPYKPTILTFDSFGTPHPQTIKTLKQYLHEEASDKRGQMEFSEKELQGVTAKQIPQQDNFCDCGLYLLGYMEKFFDDPREFINKVMRKQWDLVKDWAKLEPSSMRTKIRELLLDLEKKNRPERPSSKTHRPVPKTSKAPDEKAQLLHVNGVKSSPAPANKSIESTSPAAPKVATKVTMEAKVLHPPASPNAEPQSAKPSVTDQQPARTPLTKPSPSERPSSHSFIVLDSQTQPADPASPSNTAPASEDPESLAISPELPSTIPDSQPPPVESPLEELPKKSTPPPPPPTKAKRRIESFSSPLAPPAAPVVPVVATTMKSSPPKPSTRRSMAKGTRSEPAATTVATDPKVVINIDD
ncbi:MAG: hypothetical protein Q9222_003728 [Ikaeria aurantiellina]